MEQPHRVWMEEKQHVELPDGIPVGGKGIRRWWLASLGGDRGSGVTRERPLRRLGIDFMLYSLLHHQYTNIRKSFFLV